MTSPQLAAHTAAAPTRMQRLRSATRLVHTQIEASLPLLDPGLTLERYRRVVEAFYGFYIALEPSLSAAAGPHGVALTLDRRAKLPLLALDLCALGRSPATIGALPRCENVPLITSESRALGALYVLEGATLGGQIIGRDLAASLKLAANSGAAFFNGYAENTRNMWRTFSDHVDGANDIDTEASIAAAIETFVTLRAWLDAAQART